MTHRLRAQECRTEGCENVIWRNTDYCMRHRPLKGQKRKPDRCLCHTVCVRCDLGSGWLGPCKRCEPCPAHKKEKNGN